MRRRICMIFTLLFMALAVSGMTLAQSGNATIANYKLNTEKSVYRAGQRYRSSALTIERGGDWVTVTVRPITIDGKQSFAHYRAKYDGNDYPVTGSLPDGADMIAYRRIDAVTTERTDKRAGKVVAMVRTVASDDGRVLTVTHKGVRPDGVPFDHTIVYERQ